MNSSGLRLGKEETQEAGLLNYLDPRSLSFPSFPQAYLSLQTSPRTCFSLLQASLSISCIHSLWNP